MLQLKKGEALELKKPDGSAVTKMRLGAGWDVAEGKSVDLDLSLIARGGAVCFYGNKEIPGAKLDKDDRTGASSAGGADENIALDAALMDKEEYTVVITIYDAVAKGQFFRDVKKAFVEVEDVGAGTKLFTYDITANGGDNSALVVGKITRKDGVLTFTAHEEFSSKGLDVIAQEAGATA